MKSISVDLEKMRMYSDPNVEMDEAWTFGGGKTLPREDENEQNGKTQNY